MHHADLMIQHFSDTQWHCNHLRIWLCKTLSEFSGVCCIKIIYLPLNMFLLSDKVEEICGKDAAVRGSSAEQKREASVEAAQTAVHRATTWGRRQKWAKLYNSSVQKTASLHGKKPLAADADGSSPLGDQALDRKQSWRKPTKTSVWLQVRDTLLSTGRTENLVKKTLGVIFRLMNSLHEAPPEYRCIPPSVHTPGYETNPQKPATKGKKRYINIH